MEEGTGPRYEDSPFGLFIRFGGGRGGMWFRYKGHVRAHRMYLAECRSMHNPSWKKHSLASAFSHNI